MFEALSSGRYLLEAEKPSFLQTIYGSSVPGRPGRLIAIASAQNSTGLTLVLQRGGVLSGTLRDGHGEPAQGVEIVALSRRFIDGRRVYRRMATGTTDDRGHYRLFGLYPDKYLVAAVPRRLTESSDFTGSSSRRQPEGNSTTVTPTYYPGIVQIAAAQSVEVGLGTDLLGLDFQLSSVAAGGLAGKLVAPDSVDPSLVKLDLIPNDWPDARVAVSRLVPIAANGAFQLANLAPGEYTLRATGSPTASATTADSGSNRQRWWGEAAVAVEAGRVAPVSLTLRRAVTVRGQLRADRPSERSVEVNGFAVSLVCLDPGSRFQVKEASVLGRDGAFQFTGILPGRYRIDVAAPAPWILARADVAKRQVAEGSIDIDGDLDINDLVLIMSDQSSEVVGTVFDGAGPAPEYVLVLFPVDRESWQVGARRVRSIRPDTAGHFEFTSLQSGDYYLAALSDVDPGEVEDPSFLTWLSAESPMRLVLAAGERKQQDVKVGR